MIFPLGLDGQIQLGISGTMFIPIIPNTVGPSVGASGGSAIGISSDGTFCGTSIYLSFQANEIAGAGIFAGVGLNLGGGKTDGQMTSGSSTTYYGEMNIGMGPGMGASATINNDGSLGGGTGYGRIFPGTALGVMAGGGISITNNLVSPMIGSASIGKMCGCK